MSNRKDERLKKDLLISVLGHLALVSLLVIINPAAGMFGKMPERLVIGSVDLTGGGTPKAPAKTESDVPKEEAKALVPPPANNDAIPDESVEEHFEPEMSEKLADIIPEKPIEKKPEKPKESPKKEKKPDKPKEETTKKVTKRPEKKPAEEPKQTAPKTVQQDGKTGVDVDASVASGEGNGGTGSYDLPYNIGMLTNRIERAWRNPVSSAETISCTIYFQVGSDGRLIGEPVIERSSGISIFDQQALMAIKRAGAFPPFPSGFDYEFIGLHLDFEYVP